MTKHFLGMAYPDDGDPTPEGVGDELRTMADEIQEESPLLESLLKIAAVDADLDAGVAVSCSTIGDPEPNSQNGEPYPSR